MRWILPLWFLLLVPGTGWAADLVVTVRTAQGAPIANAVVTVPARGGAIHFDWPYRMAQHNMQFDPFVLIVPVGAEVAFPNLDTVRHQVYSFSPTHPFELRLYGHDESRSVRFDRAGIVAMGCNIHDSMVAFIDVVDTPYAARTNAAGQAVLHDVPAGATTLRVWHPYLRAAQNAVTSPIVLPRDGVARTTVTAALTAPPARHHGY